MKQIDWSDIAPPLCLESEEDVRSFSDSVVDARERIVASGVAFNPGATAAEREERVGKVCSVAAGAFCSVFDAAASDRFEDIFEQASYLAFHLAKDHIFPDANKRTALVVSLAVISTAPVELCLPDGEAAGENAAYDWIQDVVSGSCDFKELSLRLKEHARPAS